LVSGVLLNLPVLRFLIELAARIGVNEITIVNWEVKAPGGAPCQEKAGMEAGGRF